MNSFRVLIKWLLSFTKSKWVLNDYPIKTWENPNAGEDKCAFGAGIINWSFMVGHGETPEKAIKALEARFKLRKENNPDLPRPGSQVPIKYASTEKIDKYREIAVDFFKRVLNQDYNKGFYSDGASLSPFEGPDEEKGKIVKEEIIRRTLSVYGVDITNIYDEPLYKIFEFIASRNQPK